MRAGLGGTLHLRANTKAATCPGITQCAARLLWQPTVNPLTLSLSLTHSTTCQSHLHSTTSSSNSPTHFHSPPAPFTLTTTTTTAYPVRFHSPPVLHSQPHHNDSHHHSLSRTTSSHLPVPQQLLPMPVTHRFLTESHQPQPEHLYQCLSHRRYCHIHKVAC
ncbi:hypothetical protein Pmani_026740 [Petrolisthes manimaculis]|uniref:Uncharacterized protein n=1 Tax=Petrolisthes manimaculis TaxID=1843537 RepID=A0AAE1P329_9EUCA|nr:hypothetical protein Pmani_026740 [Petrolisthes manimaculis]